MTSRAAHFAATGAEARTGVHLLNVANKLLCLGGARRYEHGQKEV
jgi:hypothetical protein